MLPNAVGEPESLRELAARVIDNGKAYVRAEVTLAKTTVTTKAAQAGPAAGLIVVAIVLVQAAATILAASLGLLLARWLGLAGGFAVAALVVLLVAGLLGWTAVKRIKGIVK
ncbi:phage holin family protein [Sphingomonas crusticola]|uniref:phage holin family protein n=1 Tax=Sphingomonas crusticola TaxID=1697973 RepID=UPI000E23EBEA|nr:phage holin family protein [Sphingomonas crusticola]